MSRQQVRINPSLDLFQTTPIPTSHESSFIQVYNTQNAILDENPITFNVRGSEHYIDLSQTMLYLRLKIVQAGGADLTEAQDGTVAFTNIPFASIFKQVKLSLNGIQISPHGSQYAYKSYLYTIFNATPGSANTLKNLGYYKDTGVADRRAGNAGYEASAVITNRSNVFELFGRPFIDFLAQNKELLSHVDMQFVFYPHSSDFCLMQAAGTNHKYIIDTAELHIRKNKISPSFILAQENALKLSNASYQYPVSTFKIFRIPRGATSWGVEDVFQGGIPTKMVITMVRNLAYAGSKEFSPYYFLHSGVKSIVVAKDGVSIPTSRPISIDFNNNRSVELYNTLLDVTDRNFSLDDGLIFDKSELASGYFFSAFDLSPDRDNFTHISTKKTGNVSIRMDFAAETAADLEVLAYAWFDVTTQISLSRNVLHTFAL